MGRVYSLAAWRRARAEVLAANPCCTRCRAEGRLVPATEVDHVIPISKGGAWFDPDNLDPICESHHAKKTREDEGKTVNWGCGPDGIPIKPNKYWR